MRRLFKSEMRSFHFLNVTQFLGALNDNIFKFLVIFFLINLKGSEAASTVLAIAGGVFVVPFLLFSASAGVLADRKSKQKVVVCTKIAELIIMLCGTLAIYLKSEVGSYSILFLMASQSAAFGPCKYGIIPEIVASNKVSKANGLLNSMTYLAVIIGTFLAAQITNFTNKNFVTASLLCIVISIVGIFTSLQIEKTPAKHSQKKLSPNFFGDIMKTLSLSHKKPHLLWAILGSAFFLFIGGFTQLNAIPFAIASLNLSEVAGSYLFLITAVGIAIGSIIAGKLSRDRVEIGMACTAGFILGFLYLLLFLFSASLSISVIMLILLGLFGGLFLIPFDAFIQLNSPDESRGQVVAATNFMSFVGVLLASIFLYLTNSLLQFSPAAGFGIIGVLSLLFAILITGRMSHLFFPYFVDKILLRFYSVEIRALPKKPCVLLLDKCAFPETLVLFSLFHHLRIFRIAKLFKKFPYFDGLIKTFHLIPSRRANRAYIYLMLKKCRKLNKNGIYTAFIPNTKKSKEVLSDMAAKAEIRPYYLKTSTEIIHKNIMGISHRKRHITFTFYQKA